MDAPRRIRRSHLARMPFHAGTKFALSLNHWTIYFAETHTNIPLTSMQFAQELLSTFSTDLGEVALVPMTGGVFTVTIWHSTAADSQVSTQESILWDRKRDGGFPGMFHFHVCLATCPPRYVPRYLGRV